MSNYRWVPATRGCVVVSPSGEHTPLNPRLDLANHSSELNCGYGGSGPAQLSLAILADHLKCDKMALKLYQAFKWRVIRTLDPDRPWTMTAFQVDTVLEQLRSKVERSPEFSRLVGLAPADFDPESYKEGVNASSTADSAS